MAAERCAPGVTWRVTWRNRHAFLPRSTRGTLAKARLIRNFSAETVGFEPTVPLGALRLSRGTRSEPWDRFVWPVLARIHAKFGALPGSFLRRADSSRHTPHTRCSPPLAILGMRGDTWGHLARSCRAGLSAPRSRGSKRQGEKSRDWSYSRSSSIYGPFSTDES